MKGVDHLVCAAVFLALALAVAWLSLTDASAEGAGLMALSCLMLGGFALLAFGAVEAETDDLRER